MRARFLLILAVVAAAVPAARAQLGFPGPTGAGSDPAGGSLVQLAQFQPGIGPRASSFDLRSGQSYQMALNCVDLFADTPTDRVAFAAPPSDATVTLVSGMELALSDAIIAGLIQVRGRGPRDAGPRPTGPSFDVMLTNTSEEPLHVAVPAGTLLVPAGQPVPEIGPGVRRLLGAAQTRGLLGSEMLAEAVWATRGFTREDVEQTSMVRLSDSAAQRVQDLLAAANLGYEFGEGSGEYARLYEQRRSDLGSAPQTVRGAAALPDGRHGDAEVSADASGRAVVKLVMTPGASPLYYGGQVTVRRSDRLGVELLHLKTGRPLEATRGPILVRPLPPAPGD
jgi:hypothetical protein